MLVLGAPTFGLAGHGLMIAPRCPCRAMVTDDDVLVIAHGEREVARFVRGDSAADDELRWLDDGYGRFGATGPSVMLDAARFEDVFDTIKVGAGALPWTALGRGFATELPPGVILLGADPAHDEWSFELHAQDGRDEFIGFQEIGANTVLRPGPGQTVVGEAAFAAIEPDGTRREIQVLEVAYSLDDREWRQAFMRVPMRAGEEMLVKAQATIANRDDLFDAARHVAATLGPLG